MSERHPIIAITGSSGAGTTSVTRTFEAIFRREKIQSVIIEGGAQILRQFLEAGLWDEARIFTSSNSWHEGVVSPAINGNLVEQTQIQKDQLSIYINNLIK